MAQSLGPSIFSKLPVAVAKVCGRTVRHGLIDAFLDPEEAKNFWRRIADATYSPTQPDKYVRLPSGSPRTTIYDGNARSRDDAGYTPRLCL